MLGVYSIASECPSLLKNVTAHQGYSGAVPHGNSKSCDWSAWAPSIQVLWFIVKTIHKFHSKCSAHFNRISRISAKENANEYVRVLTWVREIRPAINICCEWTSPKSPRAPRVTTCDQNRAFPLCSEINTHTTGTNGYKCCCFFTQRKRCLLAQHLPNEHGGPNSQGFGVNSVSQSL